MSNRSPEIHEDDFAWLGGQVSPDQRIARQIEVGAELGDSLAEQGPTDSDSTFTWEGKEYRVIQEAVAVNSIIYIDTSEKQDGSSRLGLKVVEVTKDQPPRIKTLSSHIPLLKPAAVQIMIYNGFAFQAFIKS